MITTIGQLKQDLVAFAAYKAAMATEARVRKRRRLCTCCKRRFNWYELEPGTGRCPDCMP